MLETDIPLMSLQQSNEAENTPFFEARASSNSGTRRLSPDVPHSRGYSYPSNAVSNAKYNLITFLPVVLFEQFRFFFNLYFLLVALSQIWPALRIGYLSSYVVPLAFVLSVTIGKEAYDDYLRRCRDSECNAGIYELANSSIKIRAMDLRVGNIITLRQNQRVPADLVILKSSEPSGETFIRTDQLDGETDWKLRSACPLTQNMPLTTSTDFELEVSKPEKSIHHFFGTLEVAGTGQSSSLSIDNTMWANTVVAAGVIEGIIIYTGPDTRMAMNTSRSRNKIGLLEMEVNSISKILCAGVLLLSVALVALHGFDNKWYIDILRFLILFSTIIPVSLRVNLDMAKTFYAREIEHDAQISDTIVRTSTIPEDLGRVDYLLTDKTGTITQNDMDLKKIHVGSMSYYGDSMEDVAAIVSDWDPATNLPSGSTRAQRELSMKVCDFVWCLAVCHSVTPTDSGYQAVSPDEIAIVTWVSHVGLELIKRDRRNLTLRHRKTGHILSFEILHLFPFNSESKRMGIVVRDTIKGEFWFYEKGADTVMSPIVSKNDWLDEEIANMAREGLRTLVIARRKLSRTEFDEFTHEYTQASLQMSNRDVLMSHVVANCLEHDLDLLGITGVEDKLQVDVKPSLELLRNAGIKIWMLTGDKVETAQCVAVSSRLVARGQYIHTVTKLDSINAAHRHLDYLSQTVNACLLIDGQSLLFLQKNIPDYGEYLLELPVVIACRCTPQQKADLAEMVKRLTGRRVCAIGDGGNDVSMIQAADVGVGIVGKEGHQASLAADFSVTQFCHLTRLLLWHGRNSYKRSAKLAQFVIHRGLIISVCQAVYSISSKFEPLALYQGWLMVGYATVYTMMPVFSLVTDKDVNEHLAQLYPELYKELKDNKTLSYTSFFKWVLVSLYQGIIIQGVSELFISIDTAFFKQLVLVSFSSLVLNELLMVAIEIVTWNITMAICEIVTLAMYVLSVPFLSDYFDLMALKTASVYWKTAVILAVSIIPVWAAYVINRRLNPPSYAKVQV